MLMTVLKGDLAVRQSIALIKAFKQMKDYLIENKDLLTTDETIKLTNLVNEHDTKYTFIDFIKYGAVISLPIIAATLFTLSLTIIF